MSSVCPELAIVVGSRWDWVEEWEFQLILSLRWIIATLVLPPCAWSTEILLLPFTDRDWELPGASALPLC